jgi:uncharacterized protein with PQ loop repeat
MLELFGLFAGFLFAYAAVPQAIRTLKAKKHLGTPLDIILAIFFGTIAMYAFLTLTYGLSWVITFNYSVEALSWGVLLYYRLKQ